MRQGLGAGNPERAERASWLAGGMNFLFLASVGVVFPRRVLGLGNVAENPMSDLLGRRIDLARPVNHLCDVVKMPMSVLGRMLDFDGNGTEATLLHGFAGDRQIGQTHRLDGRFDRRRLHPQVNQSPQRHIAADSAETVKVGDSGHFRGFLVVVGVEGFWRVAILRSFTTSQVTTYTIRPARSIR